MKNELSTLAVIFFTGTLPLTAQKYTLLGKVTDLSYEALPYVNIILLNKNDSTFITGTASGENGIFTLSYSSGNYILLFSSIGYVTHYQDIILTKDTRLPNIEMRPESYTLDEVVIRSNRPTITRTADRFIVSVENSPALQHKTLDRILSISPGVFVGKNGELSVNGISGVTVILNEKTLRVSGNQLINLLRSVQGQELKNIEIIPNPTSHYDAERAGGVIQINTRRKRETGLSGYLSSDFGQHKYSLYDEAVGLTYTLNRFTIYGNYNFDHHKSYAKSYATDTSEETGIAYYNRESYRGYRNNHSYKLGLDLDITDNHYLGVEYNGQHNLGRDPFGQTLTEIYDNSVYSGKILAATPLRFMPRNNLFNLNYIWKIDTLGQQLKVVADYSDVKDKDLTYYYNTYYDAGNSLTDESNKRQHSNEAIAIYSGQLDYIKKFHSQKTTFGTGLKFSEVQTKYRYLLYHQELPTGDYDIDPQFTDHFKYDEERYAAYLNLGHKFEKLETNLGVRGEYTRTKGVSYVQEEKNKDNYFKLFPSLFVWYKLNDTHGLMFYYGVRINRPDYSHVNPFRYYITDFSLKTGNPSLKPAIMNVVEATYVLHNKYYLALKANFQDKAFSPFKYREGEVTISTTQNISQINYYYFNAHAPISAGVWDGYNSLNIGFTENRQNHQTVHSFNMSFSSRNYFMLTDDLGLEFNTIFRPRSKSFYEKNLRNYLKIDI